MKIETSHRLNALISEAEQYKAKGNLLHAYQICETLISEFGDEIKVYILFSEVCEEMGNINPAVNAFDNFLNDENCDSVAYLYFGSFLIKNSNYDKAINVLSHIMPEEAPEVSFLIGFAHYNLAEFKDAALHLKRYLKLVKTNIEYEAIFLLIQAQIKLTEFEDALKLLKKYEQLFLFDDKFNLFFSMVYYELDMIEHAVTHIEKSLGVRPEDPLLNLWAGRIYFKTKNFSKAEKSLLIHYNNSSDIYFESCYLLAELYLMQNKIQDALKFYELAVKLEPKKRRFIAALDKLIDQGKNINSDE